MNELLKYVFDNSNLIDFVIFSRDGKIQVKRNGDRGRIKNKKHT